MRISDWSSDVCSSDLLGAPILFGNIAGAVDPGAFQPRGIASVDLVQGRIALGSIGAAIGRPVGPHLHRRGLGNGGEAGDGNGGLDAGVVGVDYEKIGRASGRERVCQYV